MGWDATRTKDTTSLVLNQHRCCWVNHAGVTAFRHRREEAKAAVKQENIARLEARLVAKERKGEEKAEREKRKLEKMAAKEAKASKQQKKVVLKAIGKKAVSLTQSRWGRSIRKPKKLAT